MAKVKKFDVVTIPVEVEYASPLLGRFFGAFVWLMIIKVKRFDFTMNGQPIFSFYRLLIPLFVKGGGSDEK